jgi:ribosome-associated protein
MDQDMKAKRAKGEQDGWTSRSQRKRDSAALQDLAEELTRLAPGRWQALPLTPDLLEALHLWRRIGDREGRRRQLQYLGRLMREADGAAIASGLAALREGKTRESALMRHTERLREELIRADRDERERLLARWPEAREELSALLDAVRQDNGPPAREAGRNLFRRLRALQTSLP